MSPQVSLAVSQGGPSRTGGKAPISGFIRVDPPRRRKNSQPAAARRVALKMGRPPRCSSVTIQQPKPTADLEVIRRIDNSTIMATKIPNEHPNNTINPGSRSRVPVLQLSRGAMASHFVTGHVPLTHTRWSVPPGQISLVYGSYGGLEPASAHALFRKALCI